MKKNFLIIICSILLSSCSLGLPITNNSNTNSSTNSSTNSKENNKKTYTHTFEAYYDYEINKELENLESLDAPRLLYKLNDLSPNTLQVNLAKHGISNVIGGDTLSFTTSEEYLNILTIYPGIIVVPEDAKDFKLEETPVYEFKIKRNEDNEQYLYCLDNNKSYPMTNRIIKNHKDLYLINDNELYDSMTLYGTFNSNQEIDSMFTYNPRLNTKDYNQSFELISETDFTLVEQEGNISTFINHNHLIQIDTSEYNGLIIGNEYIITYDEPITLIKNLKKVQNAIKPKNIKLNKTFNNDNLIDIKVYAAVDSYDGMPRYDEETGESDFSSRYWYTNYKFKNFSYENPISFNEIFNSKDFSSYLYVMTNNPTIYSSYKGIEFINYENKENYRLNKDTKIENDIIIFIKEISEITYL